jgi:two-component system cell cycle sensor histidine kinase/response regulator CckA
MKLNTSTSRVLQGVVSFLSPAAAPTRVLVVDDEDSIRQLISRVLREAGYVVETAASGTEGLEAIDRGAAFDLIVSDVRMAGMSGPRFIAQLRRTESDVKVLYLTGYADQLFAERDALWRDEAFLDKPCTPQGLIESVALLLTGHIAPPRPRRFFGGRRH